MIEMMENSKGNTREAQKMQERLTMNKVHDREKERRKQVHCVTSQAGLKTWPEKN
ncbi:hypothetical protein Scep_009749 [Stephania cephalantha]|uniref:Uncharacterized protein n=1 Tax=Stephania cephalantha TaxID=152367 RepID=A0AAP0JTQ9_9MAGN